jgi:hypothetical protein
MLHLRRRLLLLRGARVNRRRGIPAGWHVAAVHGRGHRLLLLGWGLVDWLLLLRQGLLRIGLLRLRQRLRLRVLRLRRRLRLLRLRSLHWRHIGHLRMPGFTSWPPAV